MTKMFFAAVLFSTSLFAADKSSDKPAELNLELAKKIAEKAASCGVKNKWNLSIAIVNSESNLVYFQRGDGSYSGSIEAAIAKAKSANDFQRPTKAFADSVKEGRTGLLSVKSIIAVEGGMPIKKNDKHLGAIGISGARSAEDDQCAQAALE
ncbi:MAG: uncharacterized protein K0R29_1771 [Pseudobdellovibrio sp.]|jgi:uncharacterized protein GlcG (DUF336 family)|nr:uncharacterized protein [Pseudobdellovibrio sp.]